MTTDKEHLQWIHNRIVEVYGESENVDFLIRMRKIIDKQDTELNLHNVSDMFSFANYLVENYDYHDNTEEGDVYIHNSNKLKYTEHKIYLTWCICTA